MESMRPPIPIKTMDINNFARLSLALTDGSQILWRMRYKRGFILALFTAYMYWKGDIPLLAYVETDEVHQPFLAYKSDTPRGEEFFFSNNLEDAKYKYASFIELKSPLKAFSKSLKGEFPQPDGPLLAQVEDLSSIIRVLFPLSIKEGTTFPLWHFKRGGKHVIGTCVPFEHYYESDALPVFFYVEDEDPPAGPFVRYQTTKTKGEEISFSHSTSDAKYFYAKIISVEKMPLFPHI